MLSYIVWDPMREIIKDIQPPVWYSVLFAMGFIIGYQIMVNIFKKEKHDPANVDTLTVYMVLATILGARFGHLAFYEPERFFADPLMFFRTWEGGLASHGAVLGILPALYLYSNYVVTTRRSILPLKFTKKKRERQSYLWIVDRIVITIALAGAFIRMGNFVNSEIVGKPTESAYGVVFGRVAEESIEDRITAIESAEASKGYHESLEPGLVPVNLTLTFRNRGISEDEVRTIVNTSVRAILQGARVSEHYAQPNQPLDFNIELVDRKVTAIIHTWGVNRHPTQLYEAGTCLILFAIFMLLWMRYKDRTQDGLYLGIFLIWIFGLRWFHELFKENQVAFEDNYALNMGQILSIPLVLLGVFILIRVYIKSKKARSSE